MRGKRSKQYRKLMHRYELSFNFRAPYQVLLDDEIIRDSERFKMDLLGGLERTLHGAIKPMITQCSVHALYTTHADTAATKSAWLDVARKCETRRCGHTPSNNPTTTTTFSSSALSTCDCINSVVGSTNKNRYIVASQDAEVRARCREVPGTPIVYIRRSVMIMEPMAEASVGVREREERGKVRSGVGRGATSSGITTPKSTTKAATTVMGKRKRDADEHQGSAGGNGRDDADGRDDARGAAPPLQKRRKGPKGPNPLSVKKTAKKPRSGEEEKHGAVVESQASDKVGDRSRVARVHATGDQNAEGNGGGEVDEPGKRKRRRKHKTGSNNGGGVSHSAAAAAAAAAAAGVLAAEA
ncbi:Fcf1-domain-containing protein [Cryomyces antarcticus]